MGCRRRRVKQHIEIPVRAGLPVQRMEYGKLRRCDPGCLVRKLHVMPFASQAQKGFLYANHPEVAKEFQAATPPGAKLPARAPKKKTGAQNFYGR